MRTHGRSAYTKGCRCTECTQAQRDYMREWQRRKKRETGAWPNAASRLARQNRVPCAGGCGKSLRSGSTACRECHPVLAQRAAKRRRFMEKAKRSAEATTGGAIWVAGACAWCDENFVARNRAARFCSRRCKNRAKAKGFRVKPSVRLAIYERDGWMCQLCIKPVDPALPPLDNWAASLDHIECQAWSLIPDHSPENLRLAHRWCNSKRADETYVSAADLAA